MGNCSLSISGMCTSFAMSSLAVVIHSMVVLSAIRAEEPSGRYGLPGSAKVIMAAPAATATYCRPLNW